jgi:pimeloyl-ACP methyl ester carboxylesterase
MQPSPLLIHTLRSDVHARQFGRPDGRAVLWVFGAGGGFGGPAGGVYTRLASRLVNDGIASLCVDYRYPGRLRPCVDDVRSGLEYLRADGAGRAILVGHSFGGAVVIQAGISRPEVAGVAALSSQTFGTDDVGGPQRLKRCPAARSLPRSSALGVNTALVPAPAPCLSHLPDM